MSESASIAERRKVTTGHRITACAQGLSDERGFDGFTMEDLAEAAGVSRRTLFNYFPGKLDAALGPRPAVDTDALAVFRDGGPNGDLVDDLGVLVSDFLGDTEFSRDEAEVARRVVRADPRLLAGVHERFDELAEQFTELITDREGTEFGARRSRLLVTLLACLYDVALGDVLDDTTGRRSLPDAYLDALRTTRALLA